MSASEVHALQVARGNRGKFQVGATCPSCGKPITAYTGRRDQFPAFISPDAKYDFWHSGCRKFPARQELNWEVIKDYDHN